MSDATAVKPSRATAPVTVNAYQDSTPNQGFAFGVQRYTGEIAATAGALAVGFAVGNVPGLLATAAALGTTAVFSYNGRNHDTRERPLIESTTHIERAGERVAYKVFRRGALPAVPQVWRASEDELKRHLTGALDDVFTLAIRQSLPVKTAYTYPRLALAKTRDFITSTLSLIPNGPSGVSFHEGVAARRLQRAGMITPNPRTEEHIRFACEWFKTRTGKNLG